MKEFKVTDETPIAAMSVGQFKSLIEMAMKPGQDKPVAMLAEVFGKEECSKLTGYSINSINKFVSGRKMPYYKKNGRVLFRKDEVVNWLLSDPVKTMDECLNSMQNDLCRKRKNR